MQYECLLLRRERSRLYVTLNRPELRNAFNEQSIAELALAFDKPAWSGVVRGHHNYLSVSVGLRLDVRAEARTAILELLNEANAENGK